MFKLAAETDECEGHLKQSYRQQRSLGGGDLDDRPAGHAHWGGGEGGERRLNMQEEKQRDFTTGNEC